MRLNLWRPAAANAVVSAVGPRLDTFILAVLLALFCLRIWDLGIVHSDDAAWALRAWQGRWDIIWDWATRQGRMWALIAGPLLFIALKVKGTILGDLAITGSFAVFFGLFYWVVAMHFGRRLAVLAACLNLGLYAMRWEGSLITAYPAFTWLLGSLFLVSLLVLERYLRASDWKLLATSLTLFFLSLFLHEGVTVLFALLYPLAAAHHSWGRPRNGDATSASLHRAFRSALLGWMIVVLLYALLYIGWRVAFPSDYRGNALADFDVPRIVRVALAFALNGSLLYDMFGSYSVLFADPAFGDGVRIGYPFLAFVRHPSLYAGSLAAGGLSGLLVWDALVRLRPSAPLRITWAGPALAIFTGLMIAFVPIAPVAATPKYQQWYHDLGIRAYVHTALSHFGVSLAIAAILIWVVDSLRRRVALFAMAAAMACIVALLSAAGYAMNDAIALDMRAEASRWQVLDRALRIMRAQGWAHEEIVAPRFASGSWFAVLPPSYWVEWTAARYGMNVGFATTLAPASALAGGAVLLDFVAMGETGIFMVLAHLPAHDAHRPPVADAIFVAPVTVPHDRITEQVVQFDDIRLGRREVRLISAERMPGDPSVRVIRPVEADPSSINVLPQSSMISLPIACATPLLPADHVTFGTSPGQRESMCVGTAFLGEGWNPPERAGVWSRSRTALINLPIGNRATDLRVRMTLRTYTGLGFYDADTNLQVRAGGRLVAERHDAFRSAMSPIEFVVRRDDVGADGSVTITVDVDRTYNPAHLGLSPDDRDLGAHLETLELLPMPD